MRLRKRSVCNFDLINDNSSLANFGKTKQALSIKVFVALG
jgi:hypothetical protein